MSRQGKGNWWYDPVRPPTDAEKASFVSEISDAAVKAERKWGVPAPILAGIPIVESGYGLTRLALKSNNVLAFKWPGAELAANLKPFILWCQPDWNGGDVYPSCANRGDAVEFVAPRLRQSSYYAAAAD